MTEPTQFSSFKEFWPFYLSQHRKGGTRLLHVIGITIALGFLLYAVYARDLRFFGIAVLCGYGPAWLGHFLIEKNRPATWKYPLYSFLGDFKMYYLFLTGRLRE